MLEVLHKFRDGLAEALEWNQANGYALTRDDRILYKKYRIVCRAIRRLERLEKKRAGYGHE